MLWCEAALERLFGIYLIVALYVRALTFHELRQRRLAVERVAAGEADKVGVAPDLMSRAG